MHLPPEILEQIFQYTSIGYRGQLDHWSYCLVSRSWYASSIKRLYHSPSIIGKNFDAFARTLCPSVNANIRRTELALFVYRLDMSKLVYNGSKSLTARVLGRVKGQLEVFIAPAATFSLLAFSALAKCVNLRLLNLEYVIERMDAVLLLRTVAKLPNLYSLSLRTAWVAETNHKKEEVLDLPPSLRKLSITGVCEPEGEVLLYKAMGRSKIHTLSVMLGGTELQGLSRAVFQLKLKKLRIDIGARTTNSDLSLTTLVPDLLYHCHDMEELSIPLICLSNVFFTTSGLNSEPAYNLRRLIIHQTQMELMEPLFYRSEWQQLVNNIIDGHIQYLEQIIVEDNKDVQELRSVQDVWPSYLQDMHEALFDAEIEGSGLFLAGRVFEG